LIKVYKVSVVVEMLLQRKDNF